MAAEWRLPEGLGKPARIASYTLAARLDPKTHTILGEGRIHWLNSSREPASELRFHLYLNGFRNSASSYLRFQAGQDVETLERGGWGSVEITALRLVGGPSLLASLEPIAPDDGNPADRTVARVPLPQPVPPGGEIDLEVGFRSRLPRAVARTGFARDFHFAAQWFPKLGVLEADGHWNCSQFRHHTEFFADFGDYDVTLTVPRGFVVGATGERVESHEGTDGTSSYRYRQQGVHDFAWTAWPGFVERTRTFRHPGLPEVALRLLLRGETTGFAERYFAALEHGLTLYGQWYGPYPYPTLTMVDPPWGADAVAGMEYPTLIATGTNRWSPAESGSPEGVTLHELGHEWFYGLLASDEFHESFLDEGVNTYATARAQRLAYPPRAWVYRLWEVPLQFGTIRLDSPLDTAARYFRQPSTDPLARVAYGYLDSSAYRAQTYSKMALLMEQVERTAGSSAMERAMAAYGKAFRFRHPRTADLARTLVAETGMDLWPLLRQALAGSEVLDYAVTTTKSSRDGGVTGLVEQKGALAEVSGEGQGDFYRSEVVVSRLGGVRLPVEVELAFADGRRQRLVWDGEETWVRYRIEGPRLLWAEVDPEQKMVLDVNRLNNSRRVESDPRASRRWSQRARFWIQNLLETFASLA
ncbi:MAG: M1 family metallopeptidase [Thermoanaerobaculia bacterium]